MRARELERMLKQDGWQLKNIKGSHRQYVHPEKPGKVTIPFHPGDLNKRTEKSILEQAGLKQPQPFPEQEVYMKLVYPAVLLPFEEGEGYTITVPDLPGCVSEGNSLADALLMGTDAASGWVLDELEDGKASPSVSRLNDVASANPEAIVTYLVLDIDSYAERYGKKAIRKNITIPAYMNAYVEDNNLSLSEITQNAIASLIQNQQK